MKKLFFILISIILISIPASAKREYYIKNDIDYNLKFLCFNENECYNIRDFDKYEPVPKNLQDMYIKEIPETLIKDFQSNMNKGLKHILNDKITYNHKTIKQMLLDFDTQSYLIYQKYLNTPYDKMQNKLLVEQLKEMNGTISLYPNTIIEQIQPYIEKYNLELKPGAESDIFLYKYYIEKYHIKYSNELKELLKLKEYVYNKINIYILKISKEI